MTSSRSFLFTLGVVSLPGSRRRRGKGTHGRRCSARSENIKGRRTRDWKSSERSRLAEERETRGSDLQDKAVEDATVEVVSVAACDTSNKQHGIRLADEASWSKFVYRHVGSKDCNL
ncbi:hypothetical protein MLD38_001402 [Melastoma candidum]|uniref:Uncharacterized protein n=1 Tax=Melastoma candidum TaxID=119954 RepID=A0ACB9SCI9_9MYRT|nr:hypothetical protein MLD38_001402 [Melastoma candidum]